MIATLNGETLPVSRQRVGVVWCPFCDRSRQLEMGYNCDGCGAVFEDAPVAEVVETVEAAPESETAPESEETTEDEPEQPKRRRRSQ